MNKKTAKNTTTQIPPKGIVHDSAALLVANKNLALQIENNEKRAAELVIANTELAFQNTEKENRAAELAIAITELAFQNSEKEDRAAELIVANTELIYQNAEKEKRAAELVIANTELAFQNIEKENRAAELVIANTELLYQNTEKEKRAAELVIANTELAFQNKEKENRAAELVIANTELAFQNSEKENRAAELVIANTELIYQNKEKESRAAELLLANKELESFAFISSHDLQEPLRKIQTFTSRILADESESLTEKGKYSFDRIQHSALRMQTLIQDLLVYSRTTASERTFEKSDLNIIIKEVMETLKEELLEKKAVVELLDLGEVTIIPFQFRQLLQNLITNSLKFKKPEESPRITIKGNHIKYDESMTFLQIQGDHYHIEFSDYGIGFESDYKERIFELFQRLHTREEFEGTGIGLTIVKKIVNNHNGVISAKAQPGKGAQFDIYIPM
ncbi:sensor histidine kinase [Flavobacterium sp. 25HG05S-40]|uniref:sensor histidine kinase n=1 Tax=Flavobacterium sp. 25HG05S-40 TaxID=3458682 RepID=UPI0040446CDD